MDFKSRTNGSETIPTPTGSKMANEYAIQLDEKGHKILKKVGETNVYEKIQTGLEDTLIENILTRAALGDTSALNKIQGSYIDCTEMPGTLAEAQNRILQLKSEFDKLPIEIRREYNFSAEEFVNDAGSEKWLNYFGLKETTPEDNLTKNDKPEILEQKIEKTEVSKN